MYKFGAIILSRTPPPLKWVDFLFFSEFCLKLDAIHLNLLTSVWCCWLISPVGPGLPTLSEASGLVHVGGAAVPQHPADHVPVLLVPGVVAHRPPAPLVEHLHAALMGPRAVHQPHQRFLHWGGDGQTHTQRWTVVQSLSQWQQIFCIRYLTIKTWLNSFTSARMLTEAQMT